jgi:hypothetical protein
MKRALGVGAVLGVLVLTGCAPAPATPDDIRIEKPVGVSSERAAFSGEWEGTWEGGRGIRLTFAVEKVSRDTAVVVYSWGGAQRGFTRQRAVFKGNSLVFETEHGIPLKFELVSGQELRGTAQDAGGVFHTALRRKGAPFPGLRLKPPTLLQAGVLLMVLVVFGVPLSLAFAAWRREHTRRNLMSASASPA